MKFHSRPLIASHPVYYLPPVRSLLGLIATLIVAFGPIFSAVAQQAQTISWKAPALKTVLVWGKTYPLTATSSSGLPVTFSVRSGPATVTGGQLVATNLGMITVVAEQLGDATHAPARVERRFNHPRHTPEKESAWPQQGRGNIVDIAVSGSRAYVAEDSLGMQVLDVSQTNRAIVLATWKGEDNDFYGIEASGNTVFISDPNGIKILDVSDLANIRQVGTYDDAGGYNNIKISGTKLLVWSSPSVILDISDPTKPIQVGEYDFAAPSTVQNDRVYTVTPSSRGLMVLDIRTPESIRELGKVEMLSVGKVSDIAIEGTTAHVVGQMGYSMVDVTDPAKPRETAFFPTPHAIIYVGVQGSRVVVSGSDLCRVLDVSNPLSIREIWQGRWRGWSDGITTADGKAFLRNAGSLAVLDLKGSEAVRVFSQTPLSGSASGLGMLGGRIWLADGAGGLKTFEQGGSQSVEASPSSLVYPSTMDRFGDRMVVVGKDAQSHSGLDIVSVTNGLPTGVVGTWRADHAPGLARRVVIVNDLAYVVGEELNIYNISDLKTPKWVGKVATRRFDARDEWGLQVVGDAVYFSDIGGVYRLDSKMPTRAPERVLDGIGLDEARFKVSPNGQRLYRLIGETFDVWDIQNANSPQLLGSASVGNPWFTQLEVDGNTAWLKDYSSVQGLDFSNLAAIKMLTPITHPLGLGLYGMTVKEGTLYLSTYLGVQLLDVRNPAEPKPLSEEFKTSVFWGDKILVRGATAFHINGDRNLSILDVSDPKSIRQQKEYKAGVVTDFDVSGNRIALASETGGLILLEKAPNGDLVFQGTARSSGEPQRVRVIGNKAFVAERGAGVRIISLEDPTQPKEIGWVDTPSSPNDLSVEGNLLYVATQLSGLQIFDISETTRPVHVGKQGAPVVDGDPREADSLQIVGKTAYVSYGNWGLRISDISDPTQPTEKGLIYGVLGRFEVVGDLAVVTLRFWGPNYGGFFLTVYDVSDPTNPFILADDSPSENIRGGSKTKDIKVVGDRIYVASELDGVRTYRLRINEKQLQTLTEYPKSLAFASAVDASRGMTSDQWVLPGLNSGQVPTYSMTRGSARIEGGRLVLEGTGEAVINVKASGNQQFQPVDDNYWVPIEPLPLLTVTGSGDVLTFNQSSPGFVLQRSPSLKSPDWKDVLGDWPVEVPASGSVEYFRAYRAQPPMWSE